MIIILAWRNIWRNKMRSIIIMMSVAAGLFAGIAVLALYKGMMQGRVRTVIESETGHIQIHQPGFTEDFDPSFLISGKSKLQDALSADKKIKSYASRSITTGMLSNATGSSGVNINGFNSLEESAVSQLGDKIQEGNITWEQREKGILVGRKLAKKMKLALGNKIVLTLTDTADNLISSAFRIKGIYQSANAPLDEINIYVKNEDLQELIGLKTGIHEIAIKLNEDEQVEQVQQYYQSMFPQLQIETWKEISPETDLLVRTVDTYSYIILIIILIALSFGIMNTMLMSVLDRKHEIGMMLALGMSRNRLMWLIILESFFLTIAGIPLAILLGVAVSGYYEKHGIDLSNMGTDLMESFGFDTMIYPSFPTEKIMGIVMLVFVTALVSSLLPAWKSLKLNPTEALQK
jgi:putative ABC transport system permease protein